MDVIPTGVTLCSLLRGLEMIFSDIFTGPATMIGPVRLLCVQKIISELNDLYYYYYYIIIIIIKR